MKRDIRDELATWREALYEAERQAFFCKAHIEHLEGKPAVLPTTDPAPCGPSGETER